MTRNLWLLLVILMAPLATQAQAKPKNFGLGFALFSPTGFSAKYFLDTESALDAAIGWGNDGVQINSDYLLIKNDIYNEKKASLNFHYGIGGRLYLAQKHNNIDDSRADDTDKTTLGFRLPVGLDVMLPKPSIEIFGDIALIINFVSSTSAGIELTVGGRYYF